MPRQRYQGLFKQAPQAAQNVTGRPDFSITDPQGFLHAVANASARHQVGRTYTDETELSFNEQGGTHLKVFPAGTEDEFYSQVARLTIAFEEMEGHPPTTEDDAFWEAVNTLHAAYEGPELGNLAESFAPFVAYESGGDRL
jgi:hypothetical protein